MISKKYFIKISFKSIVRIQEGVVVYSEILNENFKLIDVVEFIELDKNLLIDNIRSENGCFLRITTKSGFQDFQIKFSKEGSIGKFEIVRNAL